MFILKMWSGKTIQQDQDQEEEDQEFDESLDSFVLITFNYNFSFAGFSQPEDELETYSPADQSMEDMNRFHAF